MSKILILCITFAFTVAAVNAKYIPEQTLEDIRSNEIIPGGKHGKRVGFPMEFPKQASLLPIGTTVRYINTFLSSPLIQAILTNETIQDVLRDPRVQGVLKNPIVQSVLRDPIVQNITSNPDIKGIARLQRIFANLATVPQTLPTGPVQRNPGIQKQNMGNQASMMGVVLEGLGRVLGVLQRYITSQNMLDQPLRKA